MGVVYCLYSNYLAMLGQAHFVVLGKTSKFITSGCSQNAAESKSNVYHFLYKLAAAGC